MPLKGRGTMEEGGGEGKDEGKGGRGGLGRKMMERDGGEGDGGRMERRIPG